jgi:hypothetical protein
MLVARRKTVHEVKRVNGGKSYRKFGLRAARFAGNLELDAFLLFSQVALIKPTAFVIVQA